MSPLALAPPVTMTLPMSAGQFTRRCVTWLSRSALHSTAGGKD